MAKRVFFTVLLVFGGSFLLIMMCNLIPSTFLAPVSTAEGIGFALAASLLYLIFLFVYTRENFIWTFIFIIVLILLFLSLLAIAATNNITFSLSTYFSGFIISCVISKIAQYQVEEYEEMKSMWTIIK